MQLEDKDLKSIQEARTLVERAHEAQAIYARFSQAQVDRVAAAVVRAGAKAAENLARLAVEEAGFGRVESKIIKNRFATLTVWEDIRELKTVGVIARDDLKGVLEIAVPYGVIIGIIPITNPTSTTLFKGIIALKTRNAILFSPHPRGTRCIGESTRIMQEAAESAGAPPGLIGCMSFVTMDGINEAMRHPLTSLILATGGAGLVKAAYSAGKPAYGVGPGNAPAFIERSANIGMAVKAIVASQTFDNGTLCSSEQSVVIDQPVKERVLREFAAKGAHLCSKEEKALLERIIKRGDGINPDIVGRYPCRIAEMAGFEVPKETTVLLAEEEHVGPEYPLSMEKLSPILGVYTAGGWEACCGLCIELLRFGGMGHTLAIHCTNEDIIMKFALEKPVNRLLVNAPASQGAVGYATGLVPSMTLGCGAHGGNITSDNISAKNLLLIKRLARVKPGFVERVEDDRVRTYRADYPEPALSWSGGTSATAAGSEYAYRNLALNEAPDRHAPLTMEPARDRTPVDGKGETRVPENRAAPENRADGGAVDAEVSEDAPERCPFGGECETCSTKNDG